MVVSLGVVSLFLGLPEPLVRLFLDRSHAETEAIVAIGVVLLLVAAAFQIFDCLQVVILGLLRGMEDTKVPMIIVACAYWLIGAPACLLFGFHFELGAPGIWAGLAVGLFVAALALSLRLWFRLAVHAPARTG